MTFLITGGAGFIGSNLATRLEKMYPYSKVYVIDNFSSGHKNNLKNFKGEIIELDITDLDKLKQFLQDKYFKAIFHLAACTDTTITNQEYQDNNNVVATSALLELSQTDNFIFASSASVYGLVNKTSNENDILEPKNPYAFSKLKMEHIAQEYRGKFKNFIGFRFFNVYGSNEKYKNKSGSMVYQLCEQAVKNNKVVLFKNGEQKRDFINVHDVVTYLIKAIDKDKEYEIYNLGTGKAISFNYIVKRIAQELQKLPRKEYIDCPYDFFQTFTEADTRKLNLDFGNLIKYNIEISIKDLINEYSKN